MAAYHRVYDSHHLQADCLRTRISSGTLRSVIEYGLPLPFLKKQSNFFQFLDSLTEKIGDLRC